MKNPVTFSISEARTVQKKRQIRHIIILSSVILLLLGAILVIRVSTMKQEADILFPTSVSETTALSSGTDASAAGVTGEETTAGTETTLPSETTAESSAETDPGLTEPDSSAGGEPTSAGTDVTDASAAQPSAAPTPIPEADVFIPDTVYLQTVTHKVRDSAFHELQKSVQALIDEQTGVRCGFYYINLKNGEEFGYNDMSPYVIGSAVNLPVNIMLYEQARLGNLSFSDVLTYESGDAIGGTGTIQNSAIGSQHIIRELSNLSITISDNAATAMLIRKLGGIDAINDSMKLISDVVDFRTNTTYEDYSGTQQSGMNRTSPQDLAKYMEYFYQMYLAYPESYQTLFNDLAHTESERGVAAGLPSEALVCHKAGSNSFFRSETDVSLIFAEEPFVICVTAEAADAAAAKDIQKKLGELVYEYLHGCYS